MWLLISHLHIYNCRVLNNWQHTNTDKMSVSRPFIAILPICLSNSNLLCWYTPIKYIFHRVALCHCTQHEISERKKNGISYKLAFLVEYRISWKLCFQSSDIFKMNLKKTLKNLTLENGLSYITYMSSVWWKPLYQTLMIER